MIKVLGFALYGPLAASTRVRLGQFVPGLASAGIELRVTSLLGDEYLRRKFQGGGLPLPEMVRDGAARLKELQQLGVVDLALLYCELFPFMPGWMERALIRKPYIYDLDDAFYLRYRLGRPPIVKTLLGAKFDHVMAGAAAVTAGSTVLQNYALRHNPRAEHIPTVVDTRRYVPATGRHNAAFTVGWIGSPSTASYLPELVAPLAALGAEAPVNFVVIGGKAPAIPNVNVIEVEWQEHTEVDLINTFDVGVMPLPDDEWARGKCAFKLIQYMACAVPVVASPVGANVDVVTPECGLLARTADDWTNSLRQLRDNTTLRQRMGEAGRQRVEDDYSLRTALPKLAAVIRMAANKG